jgi:hypothetical protein
MAADRRQGHTGAMEERSQSRDGLKLFVVDPHTIYRRGLAACLEALPEVDSVAGFGVPVTLGWRVGSGCVLPMNIVRWRYCRRAGSSCGSRRQPAPPGPGLRRDRRAPGDLERGRGPEAARSGGRSARSAPGRGTTQPPRTRPPRPRRRPARSGATIGSARGARPTGWPRRRARPRALSPSRRTSPRRLGWRTPTAARGGGPTRTRWADAPGPARRPLRSPRRGPPGPTAWHGGGSGAGLPPR